MMGKAGDDETGDAGGSERRSLSIGRMRD